MGIFTTKSQGQLATDNIAAATVGPAAAETDTTNAFIANPLARSTRGYIIRIKAVFTLVIAAAPNPCNIRETAKAAKESDSAQASDVTLNKSNPVIYTFRYPHISPTDERDNNDTVMAS